MTKFKLIAGGLGVLAAFALGWTLRGWTADKDMALATARAEARAEAQASAAYAAEIEAGRKALAEREAEIARLTAESAALADKFKEAYANDPEAKDWADTTLPDSVVGLLR
jgi:hypothetical protein